MRRRNKKPDISATNKEIRAYCVYALKDPMIQGNNIFYIGKGTKIRLQQHIHQTSQVNEDVSNRIADIQSAGFAVDVCILVSKLTESEAFMNEAELIGAYGVQSQGGQLLNKVIQNSNIKDDTVNTSEGIYENAQNGIELIERSICSLLRSNHQGLKNAEIAKVLNLESSSNGGQKNYLTYSILGNLMAKNQIIQSEKRYYIA